MKSRALILSQAKDGCVIQTDDIKLTMTHNEMWKADNLWEEREDGQVHYLPGVRPLDIDKGIVVRPNS